MLDGDGVSGDGRLKAVGEEAVRQRLEALICSSGIGYAQLSRVIGRNPAYIQQYLKRGVPRRLGEVERRRIAGHFGVSEGELGGRMSDAAATSGPKAAVGRHDDIVLLPYLDPLTGVAMAGEDAARLCFDPALAGQCGRNVESLAALRIESDAMYPTLADGDRIVIDLSDRSRLRDGIYVVVTGGGLMVKRLTVSPISGRISILSDNPLYPAFPDCAPDEIHVLGRAKWVGKRLG